MKLIVTDTNWADEMDIWGYEVIPTVERYNLQLQAIDEVFKYIDTLTLYIGSNEEIDFNKNYRYHFKVTDITQEQADALSSIFGSLTKGHHLFDNLVETALDILEEYDLEKSKELSDLIYT